MPLRIRCPHCREIVEIDDASTGMPTTCRNCGGGFKVPQRSVAPPPPRPQASEIPLRCPRCKADVAAGTLTCPRCLTEIRSGRRLPLAQRLKRLSIRTWVVTLLSVVGVAVAAAVVIEWSRHRRPGDIIGDIAAPPAADEPREVTAVRDLLNARDSATRRATSEALLRLGASAYPTLAAALGRVTRPGADAEATRTIVAALDLLARSGDSRYLASIRNLADESTIKDAVLRARGMLGDAEVAPALAVGWTQQLRRRMFFDRLADHVGPSNPTVAALVRRERREYDRWSEALRRLATVDESRSFESMLEGYWNGLCWLGQIRDERFVPALWDAARPASDPDLQLRHRTRAARRVLDNASGSVPAGARAAAGIVLAQAASLEESARRDVIKAVAAVIPSSTPIEQQRAVWALACLAAQNFQRLPVNPSPSDVDAATVAAASEWAASVGAGTSATIRPSANAAYAAPPIINRRVFTPQRQHEAAMLADLGRDWPSSSRAVAEWQDAQMGFTPRLAALLDARQRQPRYPALVGAMCLAVATDAAPAQDSLRLWTQSKDQPGWVRGLAYTALAAGEARAARPTTGWPGGLTSDMLGDLDLGPPGIAPWAELLSLGGERMLNTLRTEELAIPESARSKLLFAGEQALRRRKVAVTAGSPEP